MRPRVNTAGQIEDLLKACALKKFCHLPAARAAMADHDQSGVPVEFVKTLRNLTHRDMDGSLKLRKLEFGRLANIEKYDPVGVRFVWPAVAELFGR